MEETEFIKTEECKDGTILVTIKPLKKEFYIFNIEELEEKVHDVIKAFVHASNSYGNTIERELCDIWLEN